MERYEAAIRLVAAMSIMHEEHDHHGQRTAVLARQLAEATGLPEKQVDLITVGAHLHDIGKLMLSKNLLNAPRKLEPHERLQMEMHSTIGWALVDQAGFETAICEIVRHHHERYDGNGYPDKLQFQQIPIGARIVGLCDAYEALTSPRSYRKAYTPGFAKSYVQAEKGKAFDPRLVDLLFEKVVKDS